MSETIKEACIEMIKNGSADCVIADGSAVLYDAKGRGVMPLYDFYKERWDGGQGLYVYDKVMGKGAATLAAGMGAAAVWAGLMSEGAQDILGAAGVPFTYEKAAPHIINREGTDLCPLEKRLAGAAGVEKGLEIITDWCESLKNR